MALSPSGRIRINVTGARGGLGIDLQGVPTPGQFLTKVSGGNRRFAAVTPVSGPVNAVALTDLAGSDGAELVGYGARSLAEKLSEQISVKDSPYNAVGDGVADDTDAFEDAIMDGMTRGVRVFIPKGRYRITRSLKVTRKLIMYGDGAAQNGTSLINDMVDQTVPLLDISIPSGQSFVTGSIGGFEITTPGNYNNGYKDGGFGMRINTATGHIVAMSEFYDIIVNNHRTGYDIGGVIYQTDFHRLRAGASPIAAAPGSAKGPLYGFRLGIISFQDITYNTFKSCEATNVRNGGYGWYGSSQFTIWINCTCDGPVDLTSIAGIALGFTVEGWTQDADASPTNYVMGFKRFKMIASPVMRGLPEDKFSGESPHVPIGVFIGGNAYTLIGTDVFDGAQPQRPIYLDGKGIIMNIHLEDVISKIPITGDGGLNGTLALDCESVTDFGINSSGPIITSGNKLGFFNKTPIVKPTGVPVTADGIHAALVSLGLIGA